MFSKVGRVAVVAGSSFARRMATSVVHASKSSKSYGKLLTGVAAVSASAYAMSSIVFADGPDFGKVRKEIEALLDKDDNMAPTLVRLAWHASGTYSIHDKTGGSDGSTMRFAPESSWGANAGLSKARDVLEPIKAANPGISYADLWTLAAAVAIEYMGGPQIKWRPGRTDSKEPTKVLDGRLPDALQGAQHLRDIFYKMGFDDREIVALTGAHAIGRCHKDASGFEGPWTRSPTTFSNGFFVELTTNTWTKKQWSGPTQYEDPSKELMMLPADMCLMEDPKFKTYVEIYAKDEQKFFDDFSRAFTKLEELGVKAFDRQG